jgi:hypothetical protein
VTHIDTYERALRSAGVAGRKALDAVLPTWDFDPPLGWRERAELRRRFDTPTPTQQQVKRVKP